MLIVVADEPPDTPRSVLIYYVFDPHYKPEWGFDLASYENGIWKRRWDGEPIDFKPLYWADVPRPEIAPACEMMAQQ